VYLAFNDNNTAFLSVVNEAPISRAQPDMVVVASAFRESGNERRLL
jgi:hypothetical protein